MSKCCGTCKYWTGYEAEPGVKQCEWTLPKVPFWAYVDEGDHGSYTESTYGKNCPAWIGSDD